MKTTKWLALFIVVIATLFGVICCGDTSVDQSTQGGLDEKEETTGDGTYDKEPSVDSKDEQKITADQIGDAHGYHDGLMFVEKKDNLNDTTLYCIDKTGKIVFSLPETQGHKYFVSLYAKSYAYRDSYAVLKVDDTVVLCDKKGNIIRPEDMGATSFLMEEHYLGKMFGHGYILARKTTTSFAGSVDEVAVFNTKLEKIVDFSASLAVSYESYFDRGWLYNDDIDYCDGFLFNRTTDRYIDLETGEMKEGVSALYTNSEKNNPAYTIVLNQYKDTLYKKHSLGNGTFGVTFRVEETQGGTNLFFVIMDKTGTFLFEPIEVETDKASQYNLASENGICVIDTSIGSNGYDRCLTVFDATGKVAELPYHAETLVLSVVLSDGVIVQKIKSFNSDDIVNIYTTELKQLF